MTPLMVSLSNQPNPANPITPCQSRRPVLDTGPKIPILTTPAPAYDDGVVKVTVAISSALLQPLWS